MARAGQHSWSEGVRFERHTDRCCWPCGLIKRTRHDGDRHWQEFVRVDLVTGRETIVARAGAPTPHCPGPPDQLTFADQQTNGDVHEAVN